MNISDINRQWVVVFLVILVSILTIPAAHAKTIFVKSDATGPVLDGSSWDNAFADLQSALDDADPGDNIFVSAGTYTPSREYGGTGVRYASFQLKNGVGIYGGFSGGETDLSQRDWEANPCILSGEIGDPSDITDNCYHVFYHPDDSNLDDTAILDGFIITRGYGGGSGDQRRGAGMYNEDASPSIANCIFKDNHAIESNYAYGGGIYNLDSSPRISGSVFMNNSSLKMGGAIYNGSSSPVITDTLFKGNRAGLPLDQSSSYGSGGGIYISGTSFPTLVRCTFESNTARYDGGGMYITGSAAAPVLINCYFSGNSSDKQHGGGMHNSYGAAPEMVNCIFSRNRAMATAKHGGAIYNYNASPTLTNCVFYRNQAGCYGDGICNLQFSDPVITNTILRSHDGDSFPDVIYTSSNSSPVVTYCNVQGGYGEAQDHNMDQDPLFSDPENNDFHLQDTSPCIDAGSNAALPTDIADLDEDGDIIEPVPMDMDGKTRRTDVAGVADTGQGDAPVVDMGAFETGQATILPGDLNADGKVNAQDIPVFAASFGNTSPVQIPAADFLTDQDVDGIDLSLFIGYLDTEPG